jgi:hypothetical protein
MHAPLSSVMLVSSKRIGGMTMNAKITGKTVIGPLLVLAGVLLLVNPGGWFGSGAFFSRLWPTLFILPAGVLFHWGYFLGNRRMYGLLVPGGILVTVAVVCQIAVLFHAWHIMWPGFILAPAVGLFELYLFGVRHKALLIPVAILSCLSLSFFLMFSLGHILNFTVGGQPVAALLLIAAGAWLLFGKKKE